MFSVVILAVGLLGLAALMASLDEHHNPVSLFGHRGDAGLGKAGRPEPASYQSNCRREAALTRRMCSQVSTILSEFRANNGTVDDVMGGAALVVKTGDAPTFLSFQRLWQVETRRYGIG